jgi:WD40 repeat protein
LIVIATVLLAILALRLFPDLSPKPLRLIRTWKAHKSPITSLAFLPDGQRLLSASWDGTVRVWEVSDGTKMDEISFGRPIRFATLSPDGQLLAISTYHPTIQLGSAQFVTDSTSCRHGWMTKHRATTPQCTSLN